MQMNVLEAKAKLSELLAAAEAGEEVVIARKGVPAVRLVAVRKAAFPFGSLSHLSANLPDFDERIMTDAELDAWEDQH